LFGRDGKELLKKVVAAATFDSHLAKAQPNSGQMLALPPPLLYLEEHTAINNNA